MTKPKKTQNLYHVLKAFFSNHPTVVGHYRDRTLWIHLLSDEMKDNKDLLNEDEGCKLAKMVAWQDPDWVFDDGVPDYMRSLRLVHQTVTAWIWNEKLPIYKPRSKEKADNTDCVKKNVNGLGCLLDDSYLIDLEDLKFFLKSKEVYLPPDLFPDEYQQSETIIERENSSSQQDTQRIDIDELVKKESIDAESFVKKLRIDDKSLKVEDIAALVYENFPNLKCRQIANVLGIEGTDSNRRKVNRWIKKVPSK